MCDTLLDLLNRHAVSRHKVKSWNGMALRSRFRDPCHAQLFDLVSNLDREPWPNEV